MKAATQRQSLRGTARPSDWLGASAPPQGINSWQGRPHCIHGHWIFPLEVHPRPPTTVLLLPSIAQGTEQWASNPRAEVRFLVEGLRVVDNGRGRPKWSSRRQPCTHRHVAQRTEPGASIPRGRGFDSSRGVCNTMAGSTNGQVTRLSTWRYGFESRTCFSTAAGGYNAGDAADPPPGRRRGVPRLTGT